MQSLWLIFLLAVWLDANSRKLHLKPLQGKQAVANCAVPRGFVKPLKGFLEEGDGGECNASLICFTVRLHLKKCFSLEEEGI